MSTSVWNSLDSAARCNLMRGHRLDRFFAYRDELRAAGHAWEGDAEDILTGYIWDAVEEQNAEDDDTL